jgi:hypothetical protein
MGEEKKQEKSVLPSPKARHQMMKESAVIDESSRDRKKGVSNIQADKGPRVGGSRDRDAPDVDAFMMKAAPAPPSQPARRNKAKGRREKRRSGGGDGRQ